MPLPISLRYSRHPGPTGPKDLGPRGPNPDQTNGPNASCENVDTTGFAQKPNEINQSESSISSGKNGHDKIDLDSHLALMSEEVSAGRVILNSWK
jgi:hypothetical protein